MGTHKQMGRQAKKKPLGGHWFPTEVGLPPHACFPKGKVFSVVTESFRGAIAGRGSVSLGLEAPAFMEPSTDTYLLEPSLSPLGDIFRASYGLWLWLGKFFLGELIQAGLYGATVDKVQCLPVRENDSPRKVQRPQYTSNRGCLALHWLSGGT